MALTGMYPKTLLEACALPGCTGGLEACLDDGSKEFGRYYVFPCGLRLAEEFAHERPGFFWQALTLAHERHHKAGHEKEYVQFLQTVQTEECTVTVTVRCDCAGA